MNDKLKQIKDIIIFGKEEVFKRRQLEVAPKYKVSKIKWWLKYIVNNNDYRGDINEWFGKLKYDTKDKIKIVFVTRI